MGLPSWVDWFVGLCFTSTASAYLVIFVFAIGFWDGSTRLTLQDFHWLLMSATIAEFVFALLLSWREQKSHRVAAFFMSASMRHMILTVLAFHFSQKIENRSFPAGFGDTPKEGGTTTHSELREAVRMAVLIGACVVDCFITIADIGVGMVAYSGGKYKAIRSSA